MVCGIRSWTLQDAEKLAQMLNNKNILDNLRDGLPYPYTADDAREYINAMLGSDKNEVFAFAITCGGELAGSIGAFRQSNIHSRTAELGYYVSEKFWNAGVATCAVKAICKYVFENSDIIRIYAEPFARNKASCRVLEKAGFVYEGTLRANAVKCGVVEDMKMYSILSTD
ncbi:MAG: GNAT family N-acetyltransferase [Clostridia bacterium]|nr:GNAT family N-acetyltransferase [Clostridia bacterium]